VIEGREMVGAKLTEKCECLAIAPEENMLAVVDALARVSIGKCRRTAAEPRRRFSHENAQPGAGKTHGRAESRTSSADHDDVIVHVRRRNASQVRMASRA
jgi:hypothetical protein